MQRRVYAAQAHLRAETLEPSRGDEAALLRLLRVRVRVRVGIRARDRARARSRFRVRLRLRAPVAAVLAAARAARPKWSASG